MTTEPRTPLQRVERTARVLGAECIVVVALAALAVLTGWPVIGWIGALAVLAALVTALILAGFVAVAAGRAVRRRHHAAVEHARRS